MKKISSFKKVILFLFFLLFMGGMVYARGARASQESGEWLIDTEDFPEVNALEVSGDIIIAGSSTVFPLVEALASRFVAEGYSGNLNISSIGTGAGFERFCTAGETDIVDASRPIKQSEIDQCNMLDRHPLEFFIGVDALVIATNPDNTWLTQATMEDLVKIFTALTWKEVNSAWPDRPIQRFIPGTDSGTFDFFVEHVFDGDIGPLLGAPYVQYSEDDNILVRGISDNRDAIGFFGYAYYLENKEVIKAININGVEANRENVSNNTYSLSRPLSLYSTSEIIRSKPHVAAFLGFTLNHVKEEIESVGYFPLSEPIFEESRALWISTIEGYF